MKISVHVLAAVVAGTTVHAIVPETPNDITCTVQKVIGCFDDSADNRTFAWQEGSVSASSLTQEECAEACYTTAQKLGRNFTHSAVEYGSQCFCGSDTELSSAIPAQDSECDGMNCGGNQSESCGNADRMLVFDSDCSGQLPPQVPNGHAYGCDTGGVAASLPFCDSTKSIDDRLDDLLSRLTLEEKAGLLSPDSNTGVSTCNFMDHGVPRLGIPPYMHLVETNTAVASACLGPEKCSVNYPGPTGLGATFNRSLWYMKGEAMGDEIRAFNNLQWYRATGDMPKSLIGLNGYGPNLNIARDPRYGRISELPGEDPFLTGTYAVNMVRGGQGLDAFEAGQSKYLKMTMGLKHYALYNVEADRAAFIPNVTAHDLWETYLPQYSLGFSAKDADGQPAGHAMGTMCSYAGLNGVPSCANDYLLNQVVRTKFNRSDVVVGTDCGAVNNMVDGNKYASSPIDAAAKTINGGTDLELGDQVWSPKQNGGEAELEACVNESKTVDTARVDLSVRRALNLRFLTGQFDPLDQQPYTKIGSEAINSTHAQQLNLEAALQSFVLLKNDDGLLPFAQEKSTAILGPHVFSKRDLMSDYKGDEQCVGGTDDCYPSIAEYFTAVSPDTTTVEQGVDLDSTNSSGIPAALKAAANADQVILFLGIGNTQEHEGIDRMNTSLPGLQEPFALEVLKQCQESNTPAAVVLINGGAVAFDPIASDASAIVEAFYPSVRGAEALHAALFGKENRWGKLPVTLYNKDFPNEVDFTNFDMAKSPGRTYKYYTGTPLFEFGHGLSYAEFDVACSATPKPSNKTIIDCEVTVSQDSAFPSGEEVLMAFHRLPLSVKADATHPTPIKELVAFERVHVSPKGSVSLSIGPNQLGMVDQDGNRVLPPGDHVIEVTNGNNFAQNFTVTVNDLGDGPIVLDTVPAMPVG